MSEADPLDSAACAGGASTLSEEVEGVAGGAAGIAATDVEGGVDSDGESAAGAGVTAAGGLLKRERTALRRNVPAFRSA